jgi:hypothetical protein
MVPRLAARETERRAADWSIDDAPLPAQAIETWLRNDSGSAEAWEIAR